jgi:RNA recognition motif-containing protein
LLILYFFNYRCYGDSKHIRKLFQKALTTVKDWPESIANAWINFERDEGTLEQIEICELKIQEQLKKISGERTESQLYSIAPNEILVNKRRGKRRREDEMWKDLGGSTFKISKFNQLTKSVSGKESTNLEINKSSNKVVNNNIKMKVTPPPGYQLICEEKKEKNSYDLQEINDKITVFISNLDYTATEEEIQDVLKPVGPIKRFKMIKDYKGRSKGYCYVQLSSPVNYIL